MQRRRLLELATAATLTAAFTTVRRTDAAQTLTIGATVPGESVWGKALRAWASKAKDIPTLEVKLNLDGSAGSESNIVKKLNKGQLQGALLSGVGLGLLHAPFRALELPGLFKSYDALDKGRDAVKGTLEAGLATSGHVLLAHTDFGAARRFSVSSGLASPADLKASKPALIDEDKVLGAVFAAIGGVHFVRTSPHEVEQAIATSIDALITPTYLAEQMGWATKLKHVATDPMMPRIGALVVTKPSFDALSAELQGHLRKTAEVLGGLKTKVRAADDSSFAALKSKLTVVTPEAADVAKWDAVYKDAVDKLKGTFDSTLLTQLVDSTK